MSESDSLRLKDTNFSSSESSSGRERFAEGSGKLGSGSGSWRSTGKGRRNADSVLAGIRAHNQ